MRPLHKYQLEGAHWLANRRFGLLADDMGLGKSAQIVTAVDLVGASQVLVIPPAGVRFVWEDQFNEWSGFGHDINVLTTSTDRPKRNAVNIVNYDLLARGFAKDSYRHTDFLAALTDIEWEITICDEAHMLKEQESLRTRAVLQTRDPKTGRDIKSIARSTKRLWLATGTPVPNGPWEIWTLLCAMNATTLDYKDFCTRYCVMGQGFDKWKPLRAKAETADELAALLGSVMMRRLKELVLPQLPKLQINDFPVPEVPIRIEDFFEEALVNKAQVLKKIKAETEFVSEVVHRCLSSEGKMSTMEIIAALEAVGSSVSFYRRWLGSVKAVSMLPIIKDELENKAVDRLVIFYYHTQVKNYLSVQLEEFNPVVIAGGVTQNARRKIIENCKIDPSKRVALIQIIAGGTGLDGLQHTFHEGILLEPDWVPLNNAQPIGRLHRMGQKWPVNVRVARLAHTLDDYISHTQLRKVQDICRIVDNKK